MHHDIIPDVGSRKRASPRLSIRARLMLLALLAVVPLTLDRVRTSCSPEACASVWSAGAEPDSVSGDGIEIRG